MLLLPEEGDGPQTGDDQEKRERAPMIKPSSPIGWGEMKLDHIGCLWKQYRCISPTLELETFTKDSTDDMEKRKKP